MVHCASASPSTNLSSFKIGQPINIMVSNMETILPKYFIRFLGISRVKVEETRKIFGVEML